GIAFASGRNLNLRVTDMPIRSLLTPALIAVGIAAAPLSVANAQYCSFPLEWPFCVAGAVVGTAANIATAPFRPYYYPSYYYYPYYYGAAYYYPYRRYHRRWRHYY